MTLAEAVLAYAVQLMAATNHNMPYNYTVMENTVAAIVEETSDVSEVETLVKIARWESGGFRREVANCKVRGDNGLAQGLFQVHPMNAQEMEDTCSKDYRKQVQVALTHLRNSVEVCKMHGYRGSDLLTIYTRGQCHARAPEAWLRWGDGKTLQKFIYTEYNVIISKKGEVLYASNAQTE
jgi:hypothetical protein